MNDSTLFAEWSSLFWWKIPYLINPWGTLSISSHEITFSVVPGVLSGCFKPSNSMGSYTSGGGVFSPLRPSNPSSLASWSLALGWPDDRGLAISSCRDPQTSSEKNWLCFQECSPAENLDDTDWHSTLSVADRGTGENLIKIRMTTKYLAAKFMGKEWKGTTHE